MNAREIIDEAARAGVTLTAAGEGIRAEPKAAVTDALRARIIAEKPAILAALRARDETSPADRTPAQLLALVERVAAAYRTPAGELEEMKRLALADPGAAWSAFLATARTEGVQ